MNDFRESQLRETTAQLRAREQQLLRDLDLVRAEIQAIQSRLGEQKRESRMARLAAELRITPSPLVRP